MCVQSIHKCICTFKYQSDYSYLYSYWPGSGKPQSIFICICLKNDIQINKYLKQKNLTQCNCICIDKKVSTDPYVFVFGP